MSALVKRASDFEIRELRGADRFLIAKEHQRVFGYAFRPTRRHFVAEKDGELAGFIGLETVFEFLPLFVPREFRGQGVPKLLTQHVLEKIPFDSGVFAVARSRHTELLCESFGMEKEVGEVYFARTK